MAFPTIRQFRAAVIASGGTIAYHRNVTAGCHLFALLEQGQSSPAVSTITDTLGNTWSRAYNSTVGSFEFEVWHASCASSGANTLTITWAAGTLSNARWWILEGVNLGTVTFDAGNSANDSSFDNEITGATLTTAGAAIVFHIVVHDIGETFVLWRDTNDAVGWSHLPHNSAATGTFAAWTVVDAATSLGPSFQAGGSGAGESVTAAFSITNLGGGGGPSGYAIAPRLVGPGGLF